MAFINTTDEALTFLKGQIDLLKKKTEEVNPSIKKLLSYEHGFDILKYGFEHISNSGAYQSSGWSYHKPNEYADTVEKIEERRKSLFAKLDEVLPSLEETRLKNAEIIEHNKQIAEKVKLIMKTMGIPDSYSERDYNSRARNPKYITRQAGYIGDITRNVSTFDTQYKNISDQINVIKTRINKWADDKIKAIRAEEASKKAEREKDAKVKLLAAMCGKYGIDALEEDYYDLLDEILRRNKYLHLAHHLLRNRNDWNEGPDRAEYDLSQFKIENEVDQKIYESIQEDIEDWQGDGRVFRDGEYGYDIIFGMCDDDLMSDYQKLTEIFPELTE